MVRIKIDPMSMAGGQGLLLNGSEVGIQHPGCTLEPIMGQQGFVAFQGQDGKYPNDRQNDYQFDQCKGPLILKWNAKAHAKVLLQFSGQYMQRQRVEETFFLKALKS